MELGVSYITAHLPDHIEADMRQLRDIGCTEVLFAIQENHIHTLTGAVRFGAGIAREHGLRPYVVVWGYANTFGGGRMSVAMLSDPEMWRVKRDGTPVAFACLNNPKLVDRFIEITDMCRANGYEGMFVDEPTVQECFCPHCRQAFYESCGKDLPASEGTEEHEAFRKATVARYTDHLCKRVKALDPSLKTIACVMPHDSDCFEAVASIPELDIFGTDPYWLAGGSPLKKAIRETEMVKEICKRKGKTSQVWLNCWRIPAGREEEIYTGGKALAEVGCDSMYTWSFRGGLGTNEACDNPELAWASVCRLYRELAGL
jgi:hypothetical protein